MEMVVYTVVTSADVTEVDLYELYLFTEDQVPKRLHVLAVCVCAYPNWFLRPVLLSRH